MGLRIRFIIIAVLLGLRLYGANSELIKAATTIGMTFTACTIIYSLVRGKSRRPMGGTTAFIGIISSVVIVAIVSNFLMKREEGLNFYLFPIIFACIGIFTLALFLMKKKNRFSIYIGGLLAGGAVAVIVLGFASYLILGATNGFTPIQESYNVALSGESLIPFAWAR